MDGRTLALCTRCPSIVEIPETEQLADAPSSSTNDKLLSQMVRRERASDELCKQFLTVHRVTLRRRLIGSWPKTRSLVHRWCSGLARVDDDPANDGLWTPKRRKRPIDGSSNLPRATSTYTRRILELAETICRSLCLVQYGPFQHPCQLSSSESSSLSAPTMILWGPVRSLRSASSGLYPRSIAACFNCSSLRSGVWV